VVDCRILVQQEEGRNRRKGMRESCSERGRSCRDHWRGDLLSRVREPEGERHGGKRKRRNKECVMNRAS
jgi:hypothetical protein